MSSPKAVDLKEVVFVNEAAEQEYRSLPDDVREAADARISVLQNNGRLTSRQLTALAGKLVGVSEIRIPFDSDTYRVYFVATYAEVVAVLDAGMKKSPRNGEMPTTQKERLIKRKSTADEWYAANTREIKARAAERAKNRHHQVDNNDDDFEPTTRTPK